MKKSTVKFKKHHQLDGKEVKAGSVLQLVERTANRLASLGIVEPIQAAPAVQDKSAARPAEPSTPKKRAADGQP